MCAHDRLGFVQRFYGCNKIEEDKRLDATDPHAVIFDQFLDSLRDGDNTEEDWNTLRKMQSVCYGPGIMETQWFQ